MTTTEPNAYLKTKVMTANPAELRLMLFDGAIKFAEKGRQGLIDKNYDDAYEGVTRCQAILMELIGGLRPEHDPDLCSKLSGLYTYMYTNLIQAIAERDPDVVHDVLHLLKYERETWVLLIGKLAEENTAASETMASTPDAQPPNGSPPTNADGLVGGRISVEG